jgi:two-component system chemotaxis response regulator CheB
MIQTMARNKVKVLVVDDSALIRQTLRSILESDPEIEVIASAANPYEAVKEIRKQTPDVITLDIEMPGMDGLTFLQKIMKQHPIPVVMISSLTGHGSSLAIKALQYGAVEVITKPKVDTRSELLKSQQRLCKAVRAAALSNIKTVQKQTNILNKSSVSYDETELAKQAYVESSDKVIMIGSSTGGTQIITHILQKLTLDTPAILIVQHMPVGFTRLFADRLNKLSSMCVKEAGNGEKIRKGCVYIAPGDQNMQIKKQGNNYTIDLNDSEPVNSHKPSVDMLFQSAIQTTGANTIGILLTGMGQDGAEELYKLKNIGAETIAQEEESCAVFGMPRQAIKLNAQTHIFTPDEIIHFIQHIQ